MDSEQMIFLLMQKEKVWIIILENPNFNEKSDMNDNTFVSELLTPTPQGIAG